MAEPELANKTIQRQGRNSKTTTAAQLFTEKGLPGIERDGASLREGRLPLSNVFSSFSSVSA
jgi:hypothetical protein